MLKYKFEEAQEKFYLLKTGAVKITEQTKSDINVYLPIAEEFEQQGIKGDKSSMKQFVELVEILFARIFDEEKNKTADEAQPGK